MHIVLKIEYFYEASNENQMSHHPRLNSPSQRQIVSIFLLIFFGLSKSPNRMLVLLLIIFQFQVLSSNLLVGKVKFQFHPLPHEHKLSVHPYSQYDYIIILPVSGFIIYIIMTLIKTETVHYDYLFFLAQHLFLPVFISLVLHELIDSSLIKLLSPHSQKHIRVVYQLILVS